MLDIAIDVDVDVDLDIDKDFKCRHRHRCGHRDRRSCLRRRIHRYRCRC